MGLESVEFLLAVEESFKVTLHESEISNREQTVADFAKLVFIKQTPPQEFPTEEAAISRVFLLLEEFAPGPAHRKARYITPDTRMFEVFSNR